MQWSHPDTMPSVNQFLEPQAAQLACCHLRSSYPEEIDLQMGSRSRKVKKYCNIFCIYFSLGPLGCTQVTYKALKPPKLKPKSEIIKTGGASEDASCSPGSRIWS